LACEIENVAQEKNGTFDYETKLLKLRKIKHLKKGEI